jgi:hypothetical protein
VLIGIEAQDAHPVVLHPGQGRFDLVALEALELRLGGGNPALPTQERILFTRLELGRDDHRYRCYMAVSAHKEMHVDGACQERLQFGEKRLASGRFEPGARGGTVRKALHDHPVDLYGR